MDEQNHQLSLTRIYDLYRLEQWVAEHHEALMLLVIALGKPTPSSDPSARALGSRLLQAAC